LPNLECPRESIKFYPTGRTEGRLIDSEEAEIYEPRQEETPLEKASKNLSKAIVELGVAIADVFQPFIEELAKYKEEESEEEPKGG
jgi:regulator of PEP synthase PpsR (kinase-PPPase family)